MSWSVFYSAVIILWCFVGGASDLLAQTPEGAQYKPPQSPPLFEKSDLDKGSERSNQTWVSSSGQPPRKGHHPPQGSR